MLNKNQILTSSGLLVVFLILYSAILGSKGILERRFLENRLNSLKEEVERLETENMNLEAKKKNLRDDETALKKEARKYYLLSEDAKVIKFKETISNETNDRLFASSIQTSINKKKEPKENLPPVDMLKFFYIIGSGAILIGVFMKFR